MRMMCIAALTWLCSDAIAGPPPLIGDITVTSATDFDDPDDPPNGVCTLRKAINNGDNHTQWMGSADCESGGTQETFIRFGNDRHGIPVESVSLNPSFGELSVNAKITMVGPVKIKGPKKGKRMRLFHVTAGGDLAWKDVSIEYGSAKGDSGGGVLSEGIFTMNGGVAQENEADRGGAFAIYGNATFSGVDILGNKAFVEGGGIWASSSAIVEVKNGTLNVNHADGPGAAICTELGTPSLTVEQSSFIANRADTPTGDGGAIKAGGTVTISDSVVANNVAQGDRGGGGILFTNGALAIVEGVEIRENKIETLKTTASGGGIRADGGGTIAISRTNVVGNEAWAGGGIHAGPNNIMLVMNSTIANNRADIAGYATRDDSGAGAGLYAEGAVGLFGTTVKGNSGLSQIIARGVNSQVEFGNAVVWTDHGVMNCDGEGKLVLDAPSFQNLDWIGGTCPVTKLLNKVDEVFEPEDTFDAPIAPPSVPLEHTIWIPVAKGPLTGAGDPTLCSDPTTLRNEDERGLSRSSCDIGAVEAK